MPNIFGNNRNVSSSVTLFEVRPDKSILILRGPADEASSILLKGTVVLCLSEPLRVQGIKLRFTGEKQVRWALSGTGVTQTHDEGTFKYKLWKLLEGPETLAAGNYEYPFSEIIPGDSSETIEGIPDSWVIYRLKATIQRNVLQQNIVAKKHIRVIRTLGPSSLEMSHAMSVQNTWHNKVEYELSTPMKAVVFGTHVTVDFKLIPLLKGLRFGCVTVEVLERHELWAQNPPRRTRQHDRVVARDHFVLDNIETTGFEGREEHQFSRNVPIPQRLTHCLQSVNTQGIKAKHSISFNIQMHNPDGHVSELHASLPIFIFISPDVYVDDQNYIASGPPGLNPSTVIEELIPPQYGDHLFDRLHSGIDTSGFTTPAGGQSGRATPLYAAQSRNVSAENVAPSLEDSLSNFDFAETSGAAQRRQETCSQSSGENDARRESEEGCEHVHTQHVEYSAEALSRVPSYRTALQSQVQTSVNSAPPTYQNATREPSPS